MEKPEFCLEIERESILERQEIIAPPNFVSVFHETGKKFLSAIDQNGLRGNIYRGGEPLDDNGFYSLKGAPDNFPWRILQPEILIPENIPQNHIKIVKFP